MSTATLSSDKRMSLYSDDGLQELAGIIKGFREERKLSLREFARLVDVSHGTVDRIEKIATDPTDSVLEALAEVLPYTYVELKAIAQGRTPEDARIYVTAEDVLGVATTIERNEQVKLLHLLIDYLQND